MVKFRKYAPVIIFTILILAILLTLGLTRFSQPVKGNPETFSVRTENDFVTDPGLVALPAEDIVAVLLESLDCNVLDKDTGGIMSYPFPPVSLSRTLQSRDSRSTATMS